jgi:hypothetical protein
LHRVTWDLRFSSCRPADPTAPPEQRPSGRLAPVGRYSATIERLSDGRMTALTEPRQFEVTDLGLATFGADDHAAEHAFDEEVAELRRAVHGAIKAAQEATERLAHLRAAALDTPMPDHDVLADIHRLEIELDAILLELRGDPSQHRYVEPRGPSIRSRIDDIATCQWNTTSSPTQTQRTAYGWAGEAFEVELSKLHEVAREVEALEQRLEAAGAPWTPGRIPTWTPGVE